MSHVVLSLKLIFQSWQVCEVDFTWNNAMICGYAHASSSVKCTNVMRTHAYNSLLPQFMKESSVALYQT